MTLAGRHPLPCPCLGGDGLCLVAAHHGAAVRAFTAVTPPEESPTLRRLMGRVEAIHNRLHWQLEMPGEPPRLISAY